MNKEDLLEYLENVWQYMKLSELCKTYNNTYPDNAIDYNNLRSAIKGTAVNRLSEDKLTAFYDFLIKDIFEKKFKIKSNDLISAEIEQIICNQTEEMVSQISEALEHGFSNK